MSTSHSWNMQHLTDEQIDNIINEELQEMQHYAVLEMQRYIEKNKITLTKTLEESIRAEVIQESVDAYAEMVINFRSYGRYKDMRVIRHDAQLPNIDAIKEWVRNVGVDKFEFIPGYTNKGKMPSRSRAESRIAWGVMYGLMKKGMIRRRGKGFYNIGRSTAAKKFRRNVVSRLQRVILNAIGGDLAEAV